MKIIPVSEPHTDRNEYDEIWDKILDDFHFYPYYDAEPRSWILLPMPHKKYHLNNCFTEEQEKIINSIFCRINAKDMYALDFRHDCFIYNPCEEIPLYYWFHDKERDCNVYFPSYYPDGDFHFFVSFDWSIGLYGHPWRNEIIVAGEKLIQEFDKVQEMLNITEL